jgi:3-oxoacyl-[acyl-carrier-protein] synthase III
MVAGDGVDTSTSNPAPAARPRGTGPACGGPQKPRGGAVASPPVSRSAITPVTALGPSGRGRVGTLMGVQILGTGAYTPDSIVTNEDLAPYGFDADWVVQRTGIHERRQAPEGMVTSDVAYLAAERCLQAAGVAPADVDLILVATMTPDSPMPTTACLLQRRLGCIAPAIEMNAACSGFMYALVTGAQYVKSGCARRVLVVGVDLMSRVVNPADKRTYPLFGDGGGAVLLGAGESDQGLVRYTLGAEGDLEGMLVQPAGGRASQ